MPARVTRGAVVSHRYTYCMRRLGTEPRRIAGIYSPLWTVLLTPYSMVWDWRVLKAGILLFYWSKLLYPYYSLLLIFSFSSSCL